MRRFQHPQGNLIANCIARINLAYCERSLSTEVFYSRLVRQLLRSLVTLGAIQSFFIAYGSFADLRRHKLGSSISNHKASAGNGVTKFIGPVRTFGAHQRRVAQTPRVYVYLRYIDQTPAFTLLRNYWLLRRKVSVPYQSLSA
jgi:hypothetical protein